MTISSLPEAPAAFSTRGLKPSILAALEKKGYTLPTPIQQQAWEKFNTGKHVVGQSQTGSGKTAAFLLPLLQQIDSQLAKPQAVILAPTRELALQIEEECFELTRGLFGVRGVLVCGGMSFRNQVARIERGANIIIGTPGRIMEMLRQKIIEPRQVRYLVLDEVDRMLDMGFAEEVETIWSRLPLDMQVMCFSATMPDELQYMLDKHLADGYERIKIHHEILVTKLDHAFMQVSEQQKLEHLEQYLLQHSFGKVIVFAQTKKNVGLLEKTLRVPGYEVVALHGDIDQYERIKTMKAFKSSHKIILVATDVASRGLNLQNVDLVVNYDMPQDPEDYVHRVGRTARAGQSGEAIMFVTADELHKLRRLEKVNKIQVKQIDMEGNEIPRKAFVPRSSERSSRGGYRNRFARGNTTNRYRGSRTGEGSGRYASSSSRTGEGSGRYASSSSRTGSRNSRNSGSSSHGHTSRKSYGSSSRSSAR